MQRANFSFEKKNVLKNVIKVKSGRKKLNKREIRKKIIDLFKKQVAF